MNNILHLNIFIKCTVVILFSFLFPSFSRVNANWIVYPNNPIIAPNQNPWRYVQNPSVIKHNNSWLMLLEANDGSHWKLTTSTSSSEISNWLTSSQSIIPIGWDNENSNPTLITKNSNTYQAWFTAFNSAYWLNGPDRYRLGYAYSTNGYSWTKYSNWVLYGDNGLWDSGGIARGLSVVFLNGTYHLWYAATNSQSLASNPYWRIGYATSPDGIAWTKHPNNPVIVKTTDWEYDNMMYPYVLFEDGKYKMWYGTGTGDGCTRYVYAESTNGYEWTKPADKNPVYTVPGTEGSFDRYYLSGHTHIRDGNMYKIWYSGYDGEWSIGYATQSAEPISVTPTPTPIEPVVIIPGMMASWNKEGILEGQQNPTTPWKLLPFVKEYEGLVQTLKNLGYQEGINLFLFPYDWRKSVDTLSGQLNQFIDSTVLPHNPGSKIQLVGHSLGGLVTRAWTQTDTHKDTVHNLVTVASPHKGTIQPYKPWEGGDIAQDNSFLSLASRIILELNRRSFSTAKTVIQTQLPVLQDLLPTENFLKRASDGTFINISDMMVKNTWLSDLNSNAPSIYTLLTAIKGTGFSQTPLTYTVTPPSWLDKALGNWADGKPTGQDVSDGDGIIPITRASLDDPSITVSQNHSNTVASTEGIKKILETLEIPFTENNVVSGQATTIQPGLLFLLRSPATLKVVYNGQTYTDFDGIIFIPNAENGTYQATVTGTGSGTYRLAIGQLSDGSYSWKEYNGTTSTGQQTIYTLPYTQTLPTEDPITNMTDKERLNEIDVQLVALSQLSSHTTITKARADLKLAVTALSRKDFYTVKKQLEQILLDLSTLRKTKPTEIVRLKSFAVVDTLIDAYQAILSKKIYVIRDADITRLQTLCNKEETRLNTVLETKFNQGTITAIQTSTFSEAKNYKEKAGKTTTSEKAKKYILLFQTQLLFREI